jgi:molecular chaperone GrpE
MLSLWKTEEMMPEKQQESQGNQGPSQGGAEDLGAANPAETLATNQTEPRETGQPQPQATAPEMDAAVLREKWLRALAELDNLRKRMNNTIETALLNERRVILGAFLEVMDNLERALAAHVGEQNEWVQGTQAIHRQTGEIFRRFDVEPMDCLGKPFDPHLHEALARVPDAARPENTIVEVVQAGYQFKDGTVLRPAKVVVSYQEK